MKSVTIEWRGSEMSTVKDIIETMREKGAPAGMVLEFMVIDHWYEKNYGKIYTARPPYRFTLRHYQAFSLRQLLLRFHATNLLDDVLRNSIVAEIDAGLQLRTSHSHSPQLLLT